MKYLTITQLTSLSKLYSTQTTSTPTESVDFFMPLLFTLYNSSLKIMQNNLSDIFNTKQTINSIIDYACLQNYIIIKGDLVTLSDKGKITENKYSSSLKQAEAEWRTLKDYLIFFYEFTYKKKIDPTTVDDKLINFLNHPFKYILNDTHSATLPINPIRLSDEEITQLTLFVHHLMLEKKKLANILINLAKGIACTYSMLLPPQAISQKADIPYIFLDNIFIGRLLGWCNEWHYKSTSAVLGTLKSLGFKLFVDEVTVEAVQETINKYKNFQQTGVKIEYNSLFYYINQNNKLNIDKIPNFTSLCHYLTESFGLDISKKLDEVQIDYSDDLYSTIEKIRQNSSFQKEDSFFNQKALNPVYTDHAYKVIKYFGKTPISEQGKDITGIQSIFLTYSRAISHAHSETVSRKYTWSPIMWVNIFSIQILFEQCLKNSNFLSVNLTEALIMDAYALSGLTPQASKHLQEVLQNPEISVQDSLILMAKASTLQGQIELNSLEDWEDPILELEDKSYEFNKNISDTYNKITCIQQNLYQEQLEKEKAISENSKLREQQEQLIEEKNKVQKVYDEITEYATQIDECTTQIDELEEQKCKPTLFFSDKEKKSRKNYSLCLVFCIILPFPLIYCMMYLLPVHNQDLYNTHKTLIDSTSIAIGSLMWGHSIYCICQYFRIVTDFLNKIDVQISDLKNKRTTLQKKIKQRL